MSLQTWKDEFYPTPASTATPAEAVEHSLRKWTGLLTPNLVAHSVLVMRVGGVKFNAVGTRPPWREDAGEYMLVGAGSCALCYHWAAGRCVGCPLYDYLGGEHCAARDTSPQRVFSLTGDARPMVEALRTIKYRQEVGDE